MKKKKNHVSGSGSDDMLMEILEDLTTGGGMVAAYEAKNFVRGIEGVSAALGDNEDYIINGLGAIIGVGGPQLITNPEAKRYARRFGAGFAGECIYSVYLKLRNEGTGAPAPGSKAVRGWDNAAYSLAKARAKAKLNGRDNAAPGLMGDGKRRIDELGATFPKATAGFGL